MQNRFTRRNQNVTEVGSMSWLAKGWAGQIGARMGH